MSGHNGDIGITFPPCEDLTVYALMLVCIVIASMALYWINK